MTYDGGADEVGDNTFVVIRHGYEPGDTLKVHNLSGQPLKVSTNMGTRFIHIRSAETHPEVVDGAVANKELLDAFEHPDWDGDWAIVSPEVAAKLRRSAWKWRIIVADGSSHGTPTRMDGSRVSELDSLLFRLWPVTDKVTSSALNELDYSSTEPVAIAT